MSFSLAIAVLVGLLGTLNLILTVGVIRRLRTHTELLSTRSRQASGGGPKVMVTPGEKVGDFSVTTTEGELLSPADLVGAATLFGAFAHGCSSCEERRPDFVAFAHGFPGGRDRVIAVLVGDGRELADLRALLEPVARVVLEDRPGGPVTTAFDVKGYPAFGLFTADGQVGASGTAIEDLGEAPAPVTSVL